jgi:hypothetical protein
VDFFQGGCSSLKVIMTRQGLPLPADWRTMAGFCLSLLSHFVPICLPTFHLLLARPPLHAGLPEFSRRSSAGTRRYQFFPALTKLVFDLYHFRRTLGW